MNDLLNSRTAKKIVIGMLGCYSTLAVASSRVPHKELVVVSQDELQNPTEELDNKLLQAAQQGFFYVEIPEEIRPLFEEAITFGNTFYRNEELKKVKLPTNGGYKDWEHAQMETFFCESS